MIDDQHGLLYQPSLWSDESVTSSYQIRLREANGLHSLKALAAVFGVPRSSVTPGKLYTQTEHLQMLDSAAHHPFRLSEAMPTALEGAQGPVLRWRRGHLAAQFWMMERGQLCTECLHTKAYLDYSQDFWHVPVCTEHRRELLDRCQECGAEVSLDRPALCHCGACGADFREMQTPLIDAWTTRVAEKLTSLESLPVRGEFVHDLELSPGEIASLTAFFASHTYVEQEGASFPPAVAALPSRVRLVGLELFAQCVSEDAVILDALREGLFATARYMEPFRTTAVFRWWLQSEMPPVQLGIRVANAISYGKADDVSHMAAHQGLATPIPDVSALAKALGTDIPTAEAVVGWTKLAKNKWDLAFDADDVLYARRFFEASMFDGELDLAFGMEGLSARLASNGLLTRLSHHGEGADRFTAGSLVALLRRIDERIAEERDVAASGTKPPRLVELTPREAGDLIARFLAGAVRAANWDKPWRVSDLCISQVLDGDFK